MSGAAPSPNQHVTAPLRPTVGLVFYADGHVTKHPKPQEPKAADT